MDQSEKSPQLQFIADGAGQMTNYPPPLQDTVATSSNVCIPVSSTMQPPPLPVSTPQHQLAYQEAQAQQLDHVRERLRLFWANQIQEMEPADIKNHSLPLSPIKRIMKSDKDVKMVAKESTVVLSKACEMFILDMTSRAWIKTEQDGRRIVQNKDIAQAIYKTDIFDFLEDIIPKDELREQISKATKAKQQAGSSIAPSIPCSNVPQQQGVGISIGTSAGGQQSPLFMPLYQPGPQNQQSFMSGSQAQSQQQPCMPWPQAQQQLEQQPCMPWPQAQHQLDQQTLEQQPCMPWPQAQHQLDQQTLEQQPCIPWPQAQQQLDQQTLEQQPMSWPPIELTPDQQPMPWPPIELTPDQQNPVQLFLSFPQDEQPDQQHNDD